MNVLDGLWMSRVTSHVSLRSALDEITGERIGEMIALADRDDARRGYRKRRASPSRRSIRTAARTASSDARRSTSSRPPSRARPRSGIGCRGPFPADTVFLKAFAGEFDGVLTMYHDQGQIATKLKGFNRGVTVTAGLRTVFTTPAHGTAFDIVGQGRATTGALEEAVRLGARLAAARAEFGVAGVIRVSEV